MVLCPGVSGLDIAARAGDEGQMVKRPPLGLAALAAMEGEAVASSLFLKTRTQNSLARSASATRGAT